MVSKFSRIPTPLIPPKGNINIKIILVHKKIYLEEPTRDLNLNVIKELSGGDSYIARDVFKPNEITK